MTIDLKMFPGKYQVAASLCFQRVSPPQAPRKHAQSPNAPHHSRSYQHSAISFCLETSEYIAAHKQPNLIASETRT
jgi:hypothetical protein